ncbi:hypothetical protein DRQ05_01075 [bacterium]|nr:MAG: hypothetical protein DRQ05_01075 [bacterium]
MRIYLIRHGETDWNRERRVMGVDPVPLNERGRRMITHLGELMMREEFKVIYSSTVARARESAEILADIWGAEIIEDDRLNESRFEKWIGMSFDDLKDDPDFDKYFLKPTESRFSTSETIADIQARALACIEDIVSERRAEKVAVMTHSDIVKPILAHYCGMDLDLMHRFFVPNASVSMVDLRGRFPRVPFVSCTPWKWLER